MTNTTTDNSIEGKSLPKSISEILDSCVAMCADSVVCYDDDKYIRSKLWDGEGPNNYYRNKLMNLFSTKLVRMIEEATREVTHQDWCDSIPASEQDAEAPHYFGSSGCDCVVSKIRTNLTNIIERELSYDRR